MLTIITNQINKRIARNKEPTYALYKEVIKEAVERGKSLEQAKNELSELLKEGKIIIGRTINDYYFKSQ